MIVESFHFQCIPHGTRTLPIICIIPYSGSWKSITVVWYPGTCIGALLFYYLHCTFPNPSWRQTTLASLVSKKSSHTVPHWLLEHNSTLPWLKLPPPTSCTEPLVQAPDTTLISVGIGDMVIPRQLTACVIIYVIIGASLSEPHTYVRLGDFVCIIVRHSV